MVNFPSMPEIPQDRKRPSSMFWWGLLIFLLAVGSNFLYWLKIPQSVIPWINLILPAVALLLLVIGLKRLWPSARVPGKTLATFVTVLGVLFLAVSVWGFIHARDVPGSAGAPKVGQKAPDFTLTDTSGHAVSLAELLSAPMGNSSPPKAVLLVFYRGYW